VGRVLEVVGWLIILGTLLVMVLVMGKARDPAVGVSLLFGGIPIMLTGVVIYVFGAMLTQLIAIRESSERQERLLREMQSARLVSPQATEPVAAGQRYVATEPSALVGQSQCRNCGRMNWARDRTCECGLSIPGA
jgi:hypothetical protein